MQFRLFEESGEFAGWNTGPVRRLLIGCGWIDPNGQWAEAVRVATAADLRLGLPMSYTPLTPNPGEAQVPLPAVTMQSTPTGQVLLGQLREAATMALIWSRSASPPSLMLGGNVNEVSLELGALPGGSVLRSAIVTPVIQGQPPAIGLDLIGLLGFVAPTQTLNSTPYGRTELLLSETEAGLATRAPLKPRPPPPPQYFVGVPTPRRVRMTADPGRPLQPPAAPEVWVPYIPVRWRPAQRVVQTPPPPSPPRRGLLRPEARRLPAPAAWVSFVRFEDDGRRLLIGTGHFDAEGQVHYAVRPATSGDVDRHAQAYRDYLDGGAVPRLPAAGAAQARG
jgi:hypothetical protein